MYNSVGSIAGPAHDILLHKNPGKGSQEIRGNGLQMLRPGESGCLVQNLLEPAVQFHTSVTG